MKRIAFVDARFKTVGLANFEVEMRGCETARQTHTLVTIGYTAGWR